MTPRWIILHHSLTSDGQTVSWNAIRKYHVETNHWQTIGYQLGLELIGDHYEILMGRMLNQQGAHCVAHNRDSVGICFVGNFDLTPVPVAQWDMGIHLVRSLCDIFHIPFANIRGHRDFDPKTCPGKLFDVDQFRLDVQQHKP